MKYKNLFSKGKIGNLELKNRIVMPAMGTSLATATGEASHDLIRYYEERAEGGAGLIITEITRVDDEYGVGTSNQLCVTKPNHVPQLERLAKSIHKYDSKVFVQLHHPGRQSHSNLIEGRQVVAPSPITCQRCKEEPRELTTEEVEGLVKKFVKGAKIAQMAGIDGVELHGAHGYLINQFMSPYTNKRTDKYGGHFVNRMRFITEIILGIKHICGKDFPISVRIDGDEFVEGGFKLDYAVKIARYLESLGIHAINVSNGTYESGVTIIEPISYPQGWKRHLSETIKKAVNIPVIAVDVIRKPDFAEKLLDEGNLDFVALGRGHLADPNWGKKAYNGEESTIRPCISCLHCIEELESGRKIKCAVNARVGRELEFDGFEKNGDDRKVAIIGGGPAGMESARVLALRGFKPVIFEKENELGGALNLANKPPKKEKIDWLIDNLKYEVKKLGVEVHLNTEATMEDIKAIEPYAIFLASGANPIIPPIPGVDGDNVTTSVEVLKGNIKFDNKNVAVIGSGMTGCETAEMIAENGNNVSLIEMQSQIGKDLYPANLFDINQRLNKYNVDIKTRHRLVKINKDSIVLLNTLTNMDIELPVDNVVLSLGVKPVKNLLNDLEENFSNIKVIGDASKAGRIAEAIREGFEKAYVLD
ncbi:FAD-dependent oxidoreductase [Dethiothermospora halolimnae]|uniref:oxidoreductase n=1 Tax=Dethiothermospora halolimnae TaxID=3114390 RepID=UPI003CCB953C